MCSTSLPLEGRPYEAGLPARRVAGQPCCWCVLGSRHYHHDGPTDLVGESLRVLFIGTPSVILASQSAAVFVFNDPEDGPNVYKKSPLGGAMNVAIAFHLSSSLCTSGWC